MLKKVLIILMLYALAEVCVLIYVGGLIGGFNLIMILFLSIIIGVWTVRRQGFAILQKISDDINMRRMPSEPLLDGAGLLFGGILLCVPGLISDVIGLLLLIPAFRILLIRRLKRWIRKQIDHGGITFLSFRRR
ncbi:FxsA family protein [Sporolactobacillus shoreicorticis]|uniref:FxsA family protein n=1 Tax=Sporolactobacillus shoreicorticis TaxID=1923877 RepID=A0ABW5S0Z1_9BACL|nr:FxsA family protein [Sporolactobacillus shoreicorticis]MCO7124833.1 FxsA family protein [Sporolactobacillus shoreicorticis]